MAAGLQRWVRTLTRGRRGGSAGIPPTLALCSRASSSSSSSSKRDTLPGPYPETPGERAAAAKKYNMAPADYRPHPERGEGHGDYPALPDRSQHERDPWYAWDHPDLRRNWGEPLHWDFDMYTRNRVDTSPSAVPWRTACARLLGFLGVMALGFYLGERFPAYQAVAPKQYPYGELYLERGGDPEKRPPPGGHDDQEVRHYEI